MALVHCWRDQGLMPLRSSGLTEQHRTPSLRPRLAAALNWGDAPSTKQLRRSGGTGSPDRNGQGFPKPSLDIDQTPAGKRPVAVPSHVIRVVEALLEHYVGPEPTAWLYGTKNAQPLRMADECVRIF